jgi:hypothetical protein
MVWVEVGGGYAVGAGFHFIAAGTIHVAHGHYLVVCVGFLGTIQQRSHAAAGSDDADAKGIVCTEYSGRGQSRHSTGNDEAAAIGRKWHGAPLPFDPDDLISEIQGLS